MKMNDFIEKFAEAVEVDDITTLNADTVFRDLDEWSSLMALSVIAMADEECGVVLKGEDIRNARTIEDLYNVVKSK